MKLCIRRACFLAGVLLASGVLPAPAFAKAPLPRPVPVVFSHPVRVDVLFAGGYAAPWMSPQSAWVSSDGNSVAFFTTEPSSAENPSRTLVVKEVETDAVTFQKELFAEEESAQRRFPDRVRLARARTWEALSYLEQRQWTHLARQELPPNEREFFSDACFEKHLRPKRSVSVGDLKISYQEPRVQISRGGKKVLDRRFPSWKLHQEGCAHTSPSWLKGVFVSRERGVVLLELAFCGADHCPEPASVFHVLRIPGDKPRAGGPASAQPGATPSFGYEREGAAMVTHYVTGLPAISEDGQRVALAEVVVPDENGAPSLLLTVRRPQNQEVLQRFSMLEAGEVAAARGSPPRIQELERKVLERIRQANDSLSGTQWVPLEERPLQPMVTESCQQAPAQKLQLPELELTFNQGHLVLKQEGDKAPLELTLARDGAKGHNPCNAASRTFIDAAYVARSKGVVLLRLTTCGDESCPSQEAWYHAIKLH